MGQIPARQLKTAAPVAIGTANSAGSADTTVKSDHVHDHGAQTDPTLHADATQSADGFMSSADKIKLDSLGSGLKQSVRVVVTTNITRSGTQTIDGVALNVGDRVLMAFGTNSYNGILIVQAGAWTRAPDADTAAEISGMFCFVSEGTVNAGTGWLLQTLDPITLGTTNLQFTQFTRLFTAAEKVIFDAMTSSVKRYVKAVSVANIANLTTGAPLTVDGNTMSAGDRVLVAAQSTPTQNGIYTVTTPGSGSDGVWVRASDADTLAKLGPGSLVYCYAGTTYGRTLWAVCEQTSQYIVQQLGGQPASAAPADIGTAAVGTSAKWARENHVHGHGNQASSASALHALVVSNGNSGFMSGADKLKLDNLQFKGSAKCATVVGGASFNPQSTAPNTIDGVSLATNDRVLVKDHSGTLNGIWTVTTVGTGSNGVWARSTDSDTSAKLSAGSVVFVEQGTTNADTGWLLTNDTVTLGSTTLAWARFTLTASEITKLASLVAGQAATLGRVTVDVVLETPTAVAYASTINLDSSIKNDFAIAPLTGNPTINITNPAPGRQGTIWLMQDGTGNRTVTWAVAGYTIIKDTLAVDLNPQPGANSLTQVSYAMFTLNGTNYCQMARSFLA